MTNPEYNLNEEVIFFTKNGSRVGKIVAIYLPLTESMWRYGIHTIVLKMGAAGYMEPQDSYYTLPENEVIPLTYGLEGDTMGANQ
jgi:hypothetical protein